MNEIVRKTAKWGFRLLTALLFLFWALRIYASWKELPLSLWHTFVPQEMTVREMKNADWKQYLAHEEVVFAQVKARVADRLPPSDRTPGNRFYEGSPLYPERFAVNWNRSQVLHPSGLSKGAAVFLHGISDAPYSLRHIAELYRDRGFTAVCIRLPGHGTVPGGLTRVEWASWMGAAQIAIEEAVRHAPDAAPLHLVGYSNGAALAMKYALDALENETLRRPQRLVLLSPMIGITSYARFAGLTSVPALLPPFAQTAWQNILPEYNPYKYNSFPIKAATESYRLTKVLQEQIQRLYKKGALLDLPPILTFQSIVDHTVSTPAIFYSLYEHLPENGSELVVFDINRAATATPLVRASAVATLDRMLPPLPLAYMLTIVTNARNRDVYTAQAMASTLLPGTRNEQERPLDLQYPANILSLSHIAIPFPMDDELYGMQPGEKFPETFGVNLGTLSMRSERGMLVVNMDALFRTTSNPFYPYMTERIAAGIADPAPTPASRPHIRREPEEDLYERERDRLSEYPDEQEELVP